MEDVSNNLRNVCDKYDVIDNKKDGQYHYPMVSYEGNEIEINELNFIVV